MLLDCPRTAALFAIQLPSRVFGCESRHCLQTNLFHLRQWKPGACAHQHIGACALEVTGVCMSTQFLETLDGVGQGL